MAELNEQVNPTSSVDLTNCDREPIHIPGSVQPHATMLVIEEPGLIIRQASANAPARLGLTMDRILGRPLSTFMATTDLEHLQNCLKQESLDCTPMYLPPMQESTLFASLEASIHRIEGALVLELESWPDRAAVPDQEILTLIRSLLSFSTPPGTAARFCQRAAE